ncbi:MFS transporter [Nakamurella flavida]|uniref:MFS transporter n=1 Tax=Nakamurella flavida TaxID=363630 RepID=A0A938YI60_9ACTN|nr:MFS transporter [Nakamurella flavida]MBM9476377.1 MFS transporter [Nakamurella flavida]MDP9779523.1 UMF1 family MFS transporter [Nakamurella flavida]
MSTAAVDPASIARPAPRRQVVAWSLWDAGSSGFNVVILTFVFSVYLTDSVGEDLAGGSTQATALLSWALAAAGLLIALLAPVTGQRADAGGRRKRSVIIWTCATAACITGLFWVKDDVSYLWLGLVLMAAASVANQFADVSYSAMLRQVSTPATIGRVSSVGWASGYVGGIILLLVCYVGFLAPDVGWFGVTFENEGMSVRVIALFAALWLLVLSIPLFLWVPEVPAAPKAQRVGFLASYRVLLADLKELYRVDRHAVYFLGASALYRDGLAAVFTFGAIWAVSVYGITAQDVLIFGIAANVVSAIGALVGGRFDDRVGPKPVIIVSLLGMVATSLILLFVSGPGMFWVFGLVLCTFVGPAQTSSRTFLARLAPPGREGQMFGLYATTGRAVSFLAPALVGLFTGIFDSERAGIAGIVIVLGLGLAALWAVHPPRDTAAVALADTPTRTG